MSSQVDMHLSEIIKIIVKNGLQDRAGSLLYSGYETIKDGEWYFLGQNPGGHADSQDENDKIIKQINRTNKSLNEYFDGQWLSKQGYICPPGMQHHQVNIKNLFSTLGVNLKDTCSSNLSFVRSRTTHSYSGSITNDFELCWDVHRYLLNIVRPKNILCNGSKARDFILKKMIGVKHDSHQEKRVSNKLKCYFDVGNIFISDTDEPLIGVRLFSIPHLGIYPFYPEGAQWIKTLSMDN